MGRRFMQLDVFASTPQSGNPLAVVVDADGMTTEDMQRLAHWTNLSETAFLLPPTTTAADYRVRIFTTAMELPFAGHPTLGACQAWLDAGGTPRTSGVVVQECGLGLVTIRRTAQGLAFAAPELLRSGPVDPALVTELGGAVGLGPDDVVAAEWVDNGPGWVALLLDNADAVLDVVPRAIGGARLDLGVVGPYPPGGECAFEIRAFTSDGRGGIVEDPVTGSLNASVAQWLIATGRATAPYVVSQGTRIGHRGRVAIDRDTDGTVWVGGRVVPVIAGQIDV